MKRGTTYGTDCWWSQEIGCEPYCIKYHVEIDVGTCDECEAYLPIANPGPLQAAFNSLDVEQQREVLNRQLRTYLDNIEITGAVLGGGA